MTTPSVLKASLTTDFTYDLKGLILEEANFETTVKFTVKPNPDNNVPDIIVPDIIVPVPDIIVPDPNPPRTTDFTYDFSKLLELEYEGDVHSHLYLTKPDSSGNPLENSYGRIIYRDPVLLWIGSEKADFETTVKFILKPKFDKTAPGDGLAFFMVPVDHTFPSHPDGSNLGIFGPNNPQVFAVVFKILVEGNDKPHVGINIETKASQAVDPIPDSFIGKEVTLKITYVASTGRIVASASVTNGTQPAAEVEYVCDLSGVLPQEVQVGLSGATGDFVAKHDVAYWKFHSA